MKIVHVISSLEVGGAQRLLADLLPLQKIDNDVKLVVFKNTHSTFEIALQNNGVEIISLDEDNFYNPILINKLRHFIKKADIVHAHLFPTLYWVALASIGTKVKLVYTEHSTHNRRRDRRYLRPLEQFIYNKYSAIVSISQSTQDNLVNWLKPNEEGAFKMIYNGVNLDKFKSVYDNTNKEIVMVARFTEAKDQATLIRAMKYVAEEFCLVLVGDGEERKICEEIVKNENLTNRVRFLGTREDIPQLMASAFIGVQSSKWEGFGLTAVEFMAAGKPVICTDVPGLADVVGNAGILFNVGDAKELGNKINYLINHPDVYEDLKGKGLERAKQFSIQRMNSEYVSLYRELI